MKTCTKCGSTENKFYKDKAFKDGLRTVCCVCDKLKASAWNALNKEAHKLHEKKYRENNRQKTRDKRLNYVNSESGRKQVLKWISENKSRINAIAAKYRAKKLKATLPGFDEEIKIIYDNCPDGHHVDHIIPLQGKTVSGLHVPWNLQYLTAEENFKKSNKYE